ncbi:hypothetical protein J41TS12_18850 [Paenibacillus antibioticophila]|uniref:Uncharacterized protein n=1 Tax=Paenibacillus antibioticophila TaxID=1274374 RepID=A0A919XQA3_9BACL|nr:MULTISPECIES: hypothetical protein [Paenibacillus]GIO37024.1 hypothetical protein J41TS12_18850 [Paenibacillus antibioticophila]
MAGILQDAVNGGSGAGFTQILLDFNQKPAQNPKWLLSFENKDFLTQNIEYFALILGTGMMVDAGIFQVE